MTDTSTASMKRFEPAVMRDGKFSGMWPMEDGDYVLQGDYAAERDRLAAELVKMRAERDAAMLGVVKVKPLEWGVYCGNSSNSEAMTSVGEYIVENCHEDGWGMWTPHDRDGDPANGYFFAAEYAKAAAQADRTACILAAIQPDPEAAEREARLAALVVASKNLHRDMLERAERRIDRINGEHYRIVNAGNTAWYDFNVALSAMGVK